MSSLHEGVSCDCCLQSNFKDRRYKCLVCYDYDLCATCYDAGGTTGRHTLSHPVQCILTTADYELYYGGEAVDRDRPQSVSCPYCGMSGLTVATLEEHAAAEHSGAGFEVMCPLCAASPLGDPNRAADDLVAHLGAEHGPYRPDSRQSRAQQRSRVVRPHRPAHLSDPIAELLSQLSGPRRGPQLHRIGRVQPNASSQALAPIPAAPSSVSVPAIATREEPLPAPQPHLFLLPILLNYASERQLQKREALQANRSLFAREILSSTLIQPNIYASGTVFNGVTKPT
ncbi:hypothetical protein AAG570_004584 [Ranatra chinensis]|uniref:RING-type E3 ubiquitin transferase n=1 Tax=Ranatra chinensis TaxID=642074 RepID=A0ABD0YDX0_9HEMI